MWHPRSARFCLILLGLGLLAALVLLATGTLRFSPGDVFQGLIGNESNPVAERILQRVRLPRVLTAAGVGAALGLAGAVFQSISRNALGSPDVIGFTTGAATGAIAQLVFGSGTTLAIASAAIGSGMLTALAVLLLARHGGTGPGYRLVLVGIGVGAMLTGVNTMLLAKGGLDRVASAQLWLAGSLSARNWGHVWIVGAGLALFAPVVVVFSRCLSLMEMGEDMARQLGLPVDRSRSVLVLAAVGLTSLGTAATGPIAFVALAAPQIARRLSRNSDVPILSAALTGMVLVLAADVLSQWVNGLWVLPIGLVTSSLGGLYLIAVLTAKPSS